MGIIFRKRTTPPTPPADKVNLYVDSADGLLKVKDAAGVVSGLADQSGVAVEAAARLAADNLRILATEKGAANGLATLGADSKIPGSQLPSLAIGETFSVASQAAMLALVAQRGDVAVRTDLDPDGFFLLTADTPATLGSWVQITAPGGVTSVDGQVGAVALNATYVRKWKAFAFFAAAEKALNPSGQVVSALVDFTTGATYSAANWTAVAGGGATPATAILAGGTGLSGKGFGVPAGSLDIWRAARDAASSALCEVVVEGDSLARGEGPPTLYSFVTRLRERSTAAGFTDGGRGRISAYVTEAAIEDRFGTEPIFVSARTGFALQGTLALPNSITSNVKDDTVTFGVVGSTCKIRWSRFTQGGRWSYRVNGGAAVAIEGGPVASPPQPVTTGSFWSPDCVVLGSADGLLGGGATNTIVVTNLGGTTLAGPTPTGSGAFSTGGTIPTGTYYYKVTSDAGSGESLPGAAVGPVSVTLGQQVYLQIAAQAPGGTLRFYQATSLNGAYGLIGSQATSPSPTEFYYTGTPAPGVAPPTTSSALDANTTVSIIVEPMNATGIVWHNEGVSGSDSYTNFDVDGDQQTAAAHLGIQWAIGTNGYAQGNPLELQPPVPSSGTSTPQTTPGARKPKLVILAFGTNDIQHGDAGGTPAAPAVADGGVGNLPAGTYYYKVARRRPFGGLGALGAVSAAITVAASRQIILTAPFVGSGGMTTEVIHDVFRSATAEGTYSYVGQTVGQLGRLVDNLVTAGPVFATPGASGRNIDTSRTGQAIDMAIRLARAAGADVVVVLPSAESLSNSRTLGGAHKQAIKVAAESRSCAWVDWDIALGPTWARAAAGYGGGGGNPHLSKLAYLAQANFLWDKLLSL